MTKSLDRDLNSGPRPYQGRALPTEPSRHKPFLDYRIFKFFAAIS